MENDPPMNDVRQLLEERRLALEEALIAVEIAIELAEEADALEADELRAALAEITEPSIARLWAA
jgi:hypothetical protein